MGVEFTQARRPPVLDWEAGPVAAVGPDSSVVTVGTLVLALRRRWRLCAGTAVGGIVAAFALSMAVPPDHTATTTMVLSHPPTSDSAREMLTDTQLLKSRTVARRAVTRLRLDASPSELISSYRVTALSDEILELRVSGPTSREAVRRADTIAAEFLRFRREEFERQSREVVQALDKRRQALTEEFNALSDRINRFSLAPAPGDDRAVREYGDLLTRRASLDQQIGQLRQRIDSALVDPVVVVERSRVLDPASADDRSPLTAALPNVAAGAVAGAALGAAWLIVQESVHSERPRRRAEVMASLGAPVPVSLGSLRGSARAQRRRLRRQRISPRPDIGRAVHHLQSEISFNTAGTPGLVVVSVASDGPAALVLASVATELASEGRRVLVVDLSRSAAVGTILSAPKGKTSTARLGAASATMRVTVPADQSAVLGTEADVRESRQWADVVLVLATVDPATGVSYLREWATTAVAVVTRSRSTLTALRSTGELIRAARLDLMSVILVDADPGDETVGLAQSVTTSPWAEPAPMR